MLTDMIKAAGNGVGKGPGYILLAMGQAVGLFWLADHQPLISWENFAWPLGMINSAVYGGGALKSFADAKRNNNGAPGA